MEERKTSSQSGGALPFVVGLIAALAFGWWVTPKILYSESKQPIRFSHKVHAEQGMACEDCHKTRDDGSYAGLPTNEKCGECHTDVLGADPDEKKYVEEYAAKNKEVPWLIYQAQPDNVYFTHSAHQAQACTECHPKMEGNDTPPVVQINRLSGYTSKTMMMWQCERCHAENGVSNACYVCHK
jgi:hypothetical protein